MGPKERNRDDSKDTKKNRASLLGFFSRWKWPVCISGLVILVLGIPFGMHLWNFRKGTVNDWLSHQMKRTPNELNPRLESDFARTFGVSENLSAEFERKLTEDGRADRAEIERRIAAFSSYIQKHSAEFNADPASAVRSALQDPDSFGPSVPSETATR
jgi:hypothetical protein